MDFIWWIKNLSFLGKKGTTLEYILQSVLAFNLWWLMSKLISIFNLSLIVPQEHPPFYLRVLFLYFFKAANYYFELHRESKLNMFRVINSTEVLNKGHIMENTITLWPGFFWLLFKMHIHTTNTHIPIHTYIQRNTDLYPCKASLYVTLTFFCVVKQKVLKAGWFFVCFSLCLDLLSTHGIFKK